MSLIIFVGIVVGLPRGIFDLYEKAKTQAWGAFTPLAIILLIMLMIAVVAFIVFVEGAQRRIPVQYAKRVVGRRMMGGEIHLLSLAREFRRRDSAEVRKFAAGVSRNRRVDAGHTLAIHQEHRGNAEVGRATVHGHLRFAACSILFAFFYVGIVFNATEYADNMQETATIPGIRPGRERRR